MGTTWLESDRQGLDSLLEKIKKEKADLTVCIVEAKALVPGRGAFVEIGCREDAEELFLGDVVVLWSSRTEDSYETLLKDELRHACFVSAESKTADIEQKLVSGVHGPGECIFVAVQ
ncbi:MAG: LUD domain-containing protein [Pseudomonadota bacterium]